MVNPDFFSFKYQKKLSSVYIFMRNHEIKLDAF